MTRQIEGLVEAVRIWEQLRGVRREIERQLQLLVQVGVLVVLVNFLHLDLAAVDLFFFGALFFLLQRARRRVDIPNIADNELVFEFNHVVNQIIVEHVRLFGERERHLLLLHVLFR